MIALRDSLGSGFSAGFVLTTGDLAYRADEKIYVVPINRLWTAIAA